MQVLSRTLYREAIVSGRAQVMVTPTALRCGIIVVEKERETPPPLLLVALEAS